MYRRPVFGWLESLIDTFAPGSMCGNRWDVGERNYQTYDPGGAGRDAFTNRVLGDDPVWTLASTYIKRILLMPEGAATSPHHDGRKTVRFWKLFR